MKRIALRRVIPLKSNILVYRPKGGQVYKKMVTATHCQNYEERRGNWKSTGKPNWLVGTYEIPSKLVSDSKIQLENRIQTYNY